jgi:phosphate transport system substrate-binding protein
MRNFTKWFYFIVLVFLVSACNQNNAKKNTKETILKGTATVAVDETLQPIVEDQIEVFESRYEAKIKMDAKSEAEIIRDLVKGTSTIGILSRKFTEDETTFFINKKVTPKITPFAIDAIAFISNSRTKDTLIALNDVINFMKGDRTSVG